MHAARQVVLEPAAQELVEATGKPPFLYELGPQAACQVLTGLQSGPVRKPDVDEHRVTSPAEVGDVRVRFVRPAGVSGRLPVVVYMHDGGWIFGDAATNDRLVRELAVGAGRAAAFVEYTPSPEARYPVAIERGCATAQWITRHGAEHDLDPDRMVAGKSVGGNMTAALAPTAKQRGDVRFVHHSALWNG